MNTTQSQEQIPVSETQVAPIEPATVPTVKATKNVLKTMQIVRLHEWVTAHAADCRITPDPKLAAIAQAELEFPITSANIANMRAEIGIEKAQKEAPPSLEQRIVDLERRLERLVFRMSVSAPAFDLPAPAADHPELALPELPETRDGLAE